MVWFFFAATLTVTLDDVNDFPPEFQPSNIYSARVSEASQPGVDVKQVSAVDKDRNAGSVQYVMVYDTVESESFEITDENRETGIITLASAVDHEDYKWINVTVMAIDDGEPPLNTTALVGVEVEDVNDNSPEWQHFNDSIWVWENASLNTYITYVSATDRDSGQFGRVMYYLISGHDFQFWIEPDNVSGPL